MKHAKTRLLLPSIALLFLPASLIFISFYNGAHYPLSDPSYLPDAILVAALYGSFWAGSIVYTEAHNHHPTRLQYFRAATIATVMAFCVNMLIGLMRLGGL